MSGSVSLPSIPLYLSIEKNFAGAVTATEKGDTTAQLLIKHFTAAAPSIKTPQALLSDYRSLQVVLGAYGMSSAIGQTAVLRQLMTQDPTSKTSLAATSNNTLWQTFAKAMSGWTASSTPIANPSTIASIVSAYTDNAFETKEGASEPGMQQALYFTAHASSATSINALMSDRTLLDVVETVNNLDPDQFGALDFDQQQRIVTKDVKISSFASASSIQRYAEQYLALTAENPPSTATTYSVGSLFQSDDDAPSLLGTIAAGLGITV